MAHKRNSVEVPELEKLLAGKKKKYVRYEEGAVLYSMGKNSFRQVAQDAHALLRIKKMAIVDLDILDDYLEQHSEAKIDYIHGEDVVSKLGNEAGNMGFFLPDIEKNDLFRGVIIDGVLPRKTFSMGEAHEKRYYMESKMIIK